MWAALPMFPKPSATLVGPGGGFNSEVPGESDVRTFSAGYPCETLTEYKADVVRRHQVVLAFFNDSRKVQRCALEQAKVRLREAPD